jgi:hypothetical protein
LHNLGVLLHPRPQNFTALKALFEHFASVSLPNGNFLTPLDLVRLLALDLEERLVDGKVREHNHGGKPAFYTGP